MNTGAGMNATIIIAPNRMPAPRTRQYERAYPVSDPTAIEIATEGTRILTELKKPIWMPLQLSPVQALDQALPHAENVTSAGNAKILPRRISCIVFSDVTSITYSGIAKNKAVMIRNA